LRLLSQFRIWLLALFLLSVVPLHADETKDLQKKLQGKFLKQVLVIRNFYSGDHLIFDSQGNLLKGDNAIAYDGCRCVAELQVSELEIRNGGLVLRGPRMVGDYDGSKKGFSNLSREHSEVQIDVELDGSQMNEEAITDILNKVFLSSAENLRVLAPDAWRAPDPVPAAKEVAKTDNSLAAAKEIAKVGGSVTPPKTTYMPNPEYSEEARSAKIEGDVVLWIIVSDKGKVTRIRIARCLGYGLDEKAVQAVSKWEFKPAKKDGQPVAVQLNVDVAFHLFR